MFNSLLYTMLMLLLFSCKTSNKDTVIININKFNIKDTVAVFSKSIIPNIENIIYIDTNIKSIKNYNYYILTKNEIQNKNNITDNYRIINNNKKYVIFQQIDDEFIKNNFAHNITAEVGVSKKKYINIIYKQIQDLNFKASNLINIKTNNLIKNQEAQFIINIKMPNGISYYYKKIPLKSLEKNNTFRLPSYICKKDFIKIYINNPSMSLIPKFDISMSSYTDTVLSLDTQASIPYCTFIKENQYGNNYKWHNASNINFEDNNGFFTFPKEKLYSINYRFLKTDVTIKNKIIYEYSFDYKNTKNSFLELFISINNYSNYRKEYRKKILINNTTKWQNINIIDTINNLNKDDIITFSLENEKRDPINIDNVKLIIK